MEVKIELYMLLFLSLYSSIMSLKESGAFKCNFLVFYQELSHHLCSQQYVASL